MGSSQNWLGATRQLRRHFPQWSFKLVDLPGHGDTPSGTFRPTLPDIANAIHGELNESDWVPSILVGHSFGGKTVLALSELYASTPLSLWLLDAPIGQDITVTGTSTIQQILKLVEENPQPKNREVVQEHFEDAGLAPSIGQWMTTNIRRTNHGFEWKIDPHFIRPALFDYLKRSYWHLIESRTAEHDFYFVLAGRSGWWRGDVERRLRKLSRVKLYPLSRSGHWVHIDDLEGLVNCFRRVY